VALTLMDFLAVRCPLCAQRGMRPAPVVLEVATGLARGKCPVCHKRVWASSDGHEVRVGMVDEPPARVGKPQSLAGRHPSVS
jgi:uncharacterized protein (DUF779 family)